LGLGIGDWGLGIWGLGVGAQAPIPNPQIIEEIPTIHLSNLINKLHKVMLNLLNNNSF
jgi:hypothetical protein